MFRRKEENETDSLISDVAVPASSAAKSYGENSAPAGASATASASASPSASSSTYVPTAPSAARPAAPATPASSYRPTPIAEFNRGAARSPAPEAARSPAAAVPSFGSAPEKATAIKSNRRVLTVGNDILLKGEIATCDRLVIEGRVEAKLSDVHTVEIAECGSFKGTAEVEDAEISGIFEGDLIVRNRLVIYTTGEVRGNISYGEIEIERGGRLTGQIKTVAAGAKGKATAFETEKAPVRAKETAAA